MLDRLKEIYGRAPMPALLADAQWHILFSNEAARRLLPVCGRPDGLLTFIPCEGRRMAMELLMQGQGAVLSDASLSISGRRLACTPVMEEGALVCVLVSLIDEALTDPSLQTPGISRTVSSFTFQFRQPISNILGLLSVVNNRLHASGNDSCDPYLESITQNCYQMLRSFSNMTEVIKYSGSLNQPALEKVDLWQLMLSLCESSSILLKSINIPLHWDFPQAPAFVECDQHKIITAIINLISNSCQFTREGNQISVTGRVNGSQAVISVSDRGLGIPRQYLDRIYEPYFSYDPNGTPFAGAGLGLTVVHQIITSHGGSVALTSTELEGTTVAVTLPLCQRLGDPVSCSDATALITDRLSPVYVGLSNVCRCPSQ